MMYGALVKWPAISSCNTPQAKPSIHHLKNQATTSNPMPYCKESEHKWIYNVQTMQNMANSRETLTIP